MLTDLMGGELSATGTPGEGSVFRVKLFVPEVHALGLDGLGGASLAPARLRRGYAGPRRKVLVVDNEEPDRELLVQLLQPLGFDLRTAASGHDCLDLLAAGYQPDAVLMDLAMPGIDGWETIRRLRELEVREHPSAGSPHGVGAKIAIVSANAFDKGLDNDVGVRPEDFVLKPVRHSELLDWLERQLGLRWVAQAQEVPVAVPGPAAPLHQPSVANSSALQEVVALGFYRGILNRLDQIEADEPDCAPLVAQARELARQFQFDAIQALLVPAADSDTLALR